MKTFYKSYTHQRQAQDRRDKLEAATGVKWDFYSSYGGYSFTAIVTESTKLNSLAAVKLLPHLTAKPRTFNEISRTSNIPLADVLAGAKTLVFNQQVVGTVNCMGHFAAIRSKAKWEK